MNLKTIAAVVIVSGASIGNTHAEHTINWSAETVSNIVDSFGDTFQSAWTVALGTFGDSFLPEESNAALWSTNWIELDSTTYGPSGAQGFPTFQSSVVVSDVARANEQVYMWFYSSQVPEYPTEWALISDATWTVGTVAELEAGQPGLIDSWVMQDAGVTHWGGLNSVSSGVGVQNVDPGSYDLQTHGFVNPIPEPSIALALLSTVLALGRRRSRPA